MLVIKKILGHTDNFEKESPIRDYLELEWEHLNKKRIRKKTVKGREVVINLK